MANAYTRPDKQVTYLGNLKMERVHFSIDTYAADGVTPTTSLKKAFMVACSPITDTEDYLVLVDNTNFKIKLFSLALGQEIDAGTITAVTGDVLMFGY